MNKKIKILDATSLLSTTLWIGGIVFFILAIIFEYQKGTENLVTINKIILAIFACGIAFLAIALITTCFISISILTTKWTSSDIEQQKKLYCGLNFIPLLLGIPGNIMTRKLMKNKNTLGVIKAEKKETKQEVKQETSQVQPVQTTTTSIQPQPTPSFTPTNKFPVNEPFAHNGKWMYFDGTYYYEAVNNEWVYTNTIPE